MMEGAVMEYVKMFIGLVSLVFLIMVVVLLFQLNEINTFQQEVNYQIERNGGLTDEAKEMLNKYAEIQYNGYVSFSLEDDVNRHSNTEEFSGFSVVEVVNEGGSLRQVNRGNVQSKYGTPITYAIKRSVGRIHEFFLNPVVLGESASRVRGTGNEGRQ